MVVADLDIRDCMAWRGTSRMTYQLVVRDLRHRLRSLAAGFVRDPDGFFEVLSRHRGLVGGLFALAFMLRNGSLRFHVMEIYIPDELYADFLDAAEDHLLAPPREVMVFTSEHVWSQKGIRGWTHYRLACGRSVVVYQSLCWSALSAIACSPCTVLFNYVCWSSFGCAYPSMTLRKRGLVADRSMRDAMPFEVVALRALEVQGVEISWSPARFAQEDLAEMRNGEGSNNCQSRPPLDNADRFYAPVRLGCRFRSSWGAPDQRERDGTRDFTEVRPCYAKDGMCPKAFRYFGDGESLVDFIDPLAAGERTRLEDTHMPPFGTVICWRISSSYRCDSVEDCRTMDAPLALKLWEGYIWLPAIPGVNTFARRVADEQRYPPFYIYHH